MKSPGPDPSPPSRLLAKWRDRLFRTRLLYRSRKEDLPIVLGRKRIFILPTGFGVGFAVIELVMLVGALNYSNNAALLLTCLLAAVANGSALATFRNMNGLRLDGIRAGHACAGSSLRVQLNVAVAARARQALHLDMADQTLVFHIGGHGSHNIELFLPTLRRGWMPLPALRIHATWPFGMFRAWSWLRPDQRLLIYPCPEEAGPPPPSGDHGNQPRQQHRRHEGDELASLRAYRPGDPRKHVAWKASARHEGLLVREYERPATHDEWTLDWQHTRGLDDETRIARLARWVGEARATGTRWSLHLPGHHLGPDAGSEHYHQCMRVLALMER